MSDVSTTSNETARLLITTPKGRPYAKTERWHLAKVLDGPAWHYAVLDSYMVHTYHPMGLERRYSVVNRLGNHAPVADVIRRYEELTS